MKPAAIAALGLLALAPPLGAASASAPIAVRDAFIRPAAPGQPITAAYMTLVSAADRPLRLTGVRCDCAETVEPHESRLVNGVMQMRRAGAVVVAPHRSIRFQPGGLHLMVMTLKRAILPGDSVWMWLSFDRGAPVRVRFLARR